jgi:hypothetical protein
VIFTLCSVLNVLRGVSGQHTPNKAGRTQAVSDELRCVQAAVPESCHLCTSLSVDVLELVIERMQHYELCLLSRACKVQALKVSFGSLVPVSPS